MKTPAVALCPPSLKAMTFPLNAYACGIYRAEGSVESLHYGLFENPTDDLLTAQRRATDALLAPLPPPPLRLLEVGIGLGTTGQRLVTGGYAYRGITPDRAQVAYASQRYPDLAAHLKVADFRYYRPRQPFDAVLFQESAQYLTPQALAEGCGALLTPRGLVLMAGEMPRELADRAIGWGWPGFTVIHSADWTAATAPSLAYLVGIIDRFQSALVADLALTSANLIRLSSVLAARQRAYAAGHYRYGFLVLQKCSADRGS
ncbi:MAG: class I SAM-dependent methyltransferase [Candidatus Competibacterales bacterium]